MKKHKFILMLQKNVRMKIEAYDVTMTWNFGTNMELQRGIEHLLN